MAEADWARRDGAVAGETIAAAQRSQALKPGEMRRVNVDTTVHEKAIAFPTDARLYHKVRRVLVREARRAGIDLRQSYRRVGQRALQKQGLYARAQQLKRARKETKKLGTYLGRVIRDIQRKAARSGPDLSPQLQEYLERATRIHRQQRADKHKLYSMHSAGSGVHRQRIRNTRSTSSVARCQWLRLLSVVGWYASRRCTAIRMMATRSRGRTHKWQRLRE